MQSAGTGTVSTVTDPPGVLSPATTRSTVARPASAAAIPGRWSAISQNRAMTSGSQVRTTCRGAIRRSSASPAPASGQWCTVRTASAASAASSATGSASALARTAGAAPAGRCASMLGDGSIASTRRPGGSYEPAPAPTFTTVRAVPRAASMRSAIRGSGRRRCA